MTDLRPADLPELRIELADAERNPFEQRAWSKNAQSAESYWSAYGFDRAAIEKIKSAAVAQAELFYVAATMSELSLTAGRTIPPFDISPEDMPGPCGLLVFAEPPSSNVSLAVDTGDPECTCGKPHHTVFSGALWSVASSPQGVPHVVLFPLIDQHATSRLQGGEPAASLPRLFCNPAVLIPLAHRETAPDVAASDLFIGMAKTLRAAWLLMQQPLADTSSVHLDRPAQKRARRAGQEPKPIRVISLRRAKSGGGDGGGDSNYHHQWIVRGHWRNHWHPKRQVHRPVWIAPHVKGPEGAPMIGGEKVYAWKR